MPLRRCMREHTEREFRAWTEWLLREYGVPSRTDFYLMQVAAEVRRANSRRPASVRIKDLMLDFSQDEARPGDREQAAAMSKARWLSAMTMPVRGLHSDPPHG